MRDLASKLLLLALGLSACSKSDESVDAGQNAAAQQSGAAAVQPAAGASVSIAPPPSTPPPQMTPPGSALSAPAAIGSTDEYNGAVVARDDDGNRLQGEALLKKAMMFHVEGQGHPYPTRIEELVELGTLKSLPAAPAGKKWAIDPETRQIILQ